MMRVVFGTAQGTWGDFDELTLLSGLELCVCKLDENLVIEAMCHLAMLYAQASRAFGESHAICIEIRWRLAQGFHKRHLLNGCRAALMSSIESLVERLRQSTSIFGIEHPTTLGIRASLKLCFEEQVDWTLDDIPREHIDALDEIPRPPGHKVFWK